MRLDYPLYGLAVVLFALAAVVFLVVAPDQGQLVYGAATVVLAVLVAATGYTLKPKAAMASQGPTAAPLPEITPAPAPETLATPPPPSEEPVAETQPVPSPEPVPIVETPQASESAASTPVLTAPQSAPQLSAPEEVPAISTTPEAAPELAPATASELTQIRGINAKRAEQMKGYGINSIEDLGKANPEDLAAKLEVSPRIVKMWVGSAKKQTK